jgi:uncharacterized membrane protein YkoI
MYVHRTKETVGGVMRTISFLLCVFLTPLANLTLAQSVAQPGSIKGDISAFHGDRDTLVKAIQATERSTGGKVLDIRFSNANGTPGYHAVVVKGAQVDFFKVEQVSNNVIELDASSRPVWMLNWRGKADVHYAKQATVSLSNAIRTAEHSQNGAPAAAAGIARSASNPDSDVHAYTVLVVASGNVQSVSVDSSSGEVISDPSTLSY